MTTTDLTDATPAAFSAHVSSRTQMGEIARQMIDRRITVLMGGGRAVFEGEAQPAGGSLLAEARRSYTYVSSVQALGDLEADTVDTLLGLFADRRMGVVAERGPDALSLMGTTALDILGRNPDGFFLMIENEESDEQSHGNADEATLTAEMLDFDRMIGIAIDWADEHPGTLVLVTGDHETGGMTLPYPAVPERPAVMTWATGGHTGTLIPIFAYGAGAERFGGIVRNDEVGRTLLELMRAN